MAYLTAVNRNASVSRHALYFIVTAFSICAAPAALAADYTPPKVYVTTPGGINLSDGSFMLDQTDLSIGSLALVRHHIGGLRDPNTTPYGPHMTHNFDIFLSRNVRTDCTGGPATCTHYGKPIVHLGTSASGTFHESISDRFITHNDQDSFSGELIYNSISKTYEYTDEEGTVYIFDPTIPATGAINSARVVKITFADGNIRRFIYDKSNNLKIVQDERGYAIVFDYNAYGLVVNACGYNRSVTYITSSTTCAMAQLKAEYAYDSSSYHNLTSVIDAGGREESYEYADKEVICVKPAGYSSCKVSNTGTWKVSSQTLADGSTWQFKYIGDPTKARDPDVYADTEPSFTMVVTDPNSKTSYYSFVQSSPYEIVDPLNRRTTYRYTGGTQFGGQDLSVDHGSLLTNVTYPEGNQWTAEYYGPRNAMSKRTLKAKPGSDLPDQTVMFGYAPSCDAPNNPKWCGKPLFVEDEKGRTDYAYTAFGAIESEMLPAPSADAARPLKLFTFVQQFAYVKDVSGLLIQGAAAVWLPASETQCQTTAKSSTPECDALAPRVVTSYEYGAAGTADTLLLRGKVVTADNQSLRTCYRYDAQANKIAETSPRAGLGSCP